MVVADDCYLEAGGKDHLFGLLVFIVLCATASVPSYLEYNVGWCLSWSGGSFCIGLDSRVRNGTRGGRFRLHVVSFEE